MLNSASVNEEDLSNVHLSITRKLIFYLLKSEKPLNSQATNLSLELVKFLHSSNQVVLKKSHFSKAQFPMKFDSEKETLLNWFS